MKKSMNDRSMKKRTVWLILGGIAVIVCVLWWAYIQFWSNASEKEDVSAKREADWSFQKPKVPETKLTDQEECALCGSRKGSMTGMFSGKDAIGIISVNDWYIMDLKIKSGDEKGNMPEDTEGKNTTRTTVGKNGRVLERSSESLRGISEIVVDYGEDRVLSMEKASQILCQSCLEKLSEAMEVKCEEGKEPEPVDLVLIDFETMELYSVQEQYTKKSIRDYTLWMAHTEDTLEINAVYTPVRTEAGKNAGIKENAVPSSATDDSAASLK